jgi:Tfp pilus assembly protein PilF/HEAT repeat protein
MRGTTQRMRTRLATIAGLYTLAQAPAQAQPDPWSLTRPPAAADRVHKAATDPAARAQRALDQALAAPFDPLALETLFAAFQARDGQLEGLRALLEARPATRSTLGLLARLASERADVNAAGQLYERANALGTDAAALWGWARFEHAQGALERERELLSRALAASPRGRRNAVQSELAERCLALNDRAAAGRYFAALARENPGNSGYALAFARALAVGSDHVATAQAYREALAALSGDPRSLAPLELEAARAQLMAAEPGAALALLRQARRHAGIEAGLQAEITDELLETQRRLGGLPDFAAELRGRADPISQAALARVYEELAQPAAAIDVLRRASAQRPSDLASAQRLIALLWQQGRVDDVIAQYQRLVRLPGAGPRFLPELVQLLWQAGRQRIALDTLQAISAANPRDVRLHETIAELYTRFGEAARAEVELHLLAELSPNSPARFLVLAEAELARGQQDAARAHLRRAVAKPEAVGGDLALAQIYLDHGFINEALSEFERAQQRRPDDPRAARGKAEALTRLFRFQQAAQQWQRALSLAGTDRELRREARKQLVGVWDELASLQQRAAEFAERCGYSFGNGFASAELPDNCDVELLRTLAEAYERLARRSGPHAQPQRYVLAAEAVLVFVVRLEPQDFASWLSLERLRTKRGDLDGARAALEQLTRIDPANLRTYLSRMIAQALARYHDAEAASYARRAIEAAPDDAAAHEQLGDLQRAQGDLAGARASYEHALSLDPARLGLAFRLAQLQIAAGQAAQAEPWLHAVLRSAADEELVLRANRLLLQLDPEPAQLLQLERELIPLALALPSRSAYRAALLELYGALVPLLAARAELTGSAGEAARSELAAIGRRAVKPLLDALADPDLAQVRAALLVLAQVANASVLPALFALAERPIELSLRREALHVAAHLDPSGSALGHWLILAHAAESRLQEVAVWALGHNPSAASLLELRALARDDPPLVRAQALLGLSQRSSAETAAQLREAVVHDPSPLVRCAAAIGSGRIGGAAPLDVLTETSRLEVQPSLSECAVLGMGLLGGERAAAPLARALFASDPRVRSAASLGLRALYAPIPATFEPPLAALHTLATSDLTRSARTALAGVARRSLADAAGPDFSIDGSALLTAARAALRGDDAARARTLEFLIELGAPAPPTSGSDPREHAVDVIGALWPELSALCVHPQTQLRQLLVRALAPQRRPLVDALLIDMAQDPSPEVRALALDALAERPLLEQPGWVDRLGRVAASDPAFWLRERAVQVIGKLPSQLATRALTHVLATEPYALVRERAVQSLAGRAPQRIGPALQRAAHDPEVRVAEAALALLRACGPACSVREQTSAPAN